MSEPSASSRALEKRQDAGRRKRQTLSVFLLVVAVGVVTADWVSPDAGILKTLVYGAGDVEITSTPSGAEVLLDGRLVGITPFAPDALSAGEYTIQVRHPYHQPHVENLLVGRGSTHHLAIQFQPTFGSLSLASNPEGATVTLNGEPLDQVTPLSLPKLPAGKHHLAFSIFGRRKIEREIEILPGASENLVVELNRLDTSALTVNTHPAWATVDLLHVPVKYQPGVRLPTGEYVIEVRASGFEPQIRNQKLLIGVNVIDITLKRSNAVLSISTNPSDVRIQVRAGSEISSKTYTHEMALPTGLVEVHVQKKGYRTVVKRIDLSPSGRHLDLTLVKIDVAVGEHIRDPFRDGSGFAPEAIVIAEGSIARPGRHGKLEVASPYAIGVTEVTLGEYRAFVTDTGGDMPVIKGAETDEHPVAKISWSNALAYTQWLTRQTGNLYRLPSEAEWAYVAYSGSTHGEICELGNVADQSLRKVIQQWQTEPCDDGHGRSAPVKSFKPNALGIYDLMGNVSEWVRECGRSGCDSHVIRGSAWDSTGNDLDLEYRDSFFNPGDTRGIRIVREL